MTRNIRIGIVAASVAIVAVIAVMRSAAQDEPPPLSDEVPEIAATMTAERLIELVLRVDEEAVLQGSSVFFHVEGLETAVVYDVLADRMRIIIPIGDSDDLTQDDLLRMMQANFDSALDARYAVAQGSLWGVFIHPLSTLSDEEFLVGLGQTVNVVLSYGSSYTSGMFIYGDGDSAEIERQRVIEDLRNAIT